MIIVCDENVPADIAVQFYVRATEAPWQVMVKPTYIHEDCALVLYTPPYGGGQVDGGARVVFVSLVRPIDGVSGTPVELYYVPADTRR